MKTLIAYFSRAGENYYNGKVQKLDKGNNQILAEKLKILLPDADIYKIEPQIPYSDNYYTCIEQAKEDLKKRARPKLKQNLSSIDQYDRVFLIYPIYWGTFPVHVFTFLESFDFSDKIIVPIVSHEGSGFGVSEVDLYKLLPNSIIKEGTAIYGSQVQSADNTLKQLLD